MDEQSAFRHPGGDAATLKGLGSMGAGSAVGAETRVGASCACQGSHYFLRSGSEAAALIAQHPWEHTYLGPLDLWSQSLKTVTALIMHAPAPMALLWGADGVMLYNDAYAVLAGARHPALLGRAVRDAWPEIAEFDAHIVAVVMAGGTLLYRDQELTLDRNGAPEQMWLNLDYSPVLDESGKPAGVLAIVVDTTARVSAERRTAAMLCHERAAGELREQFIAVLGHDLRNPLQAVSATAELLQRRLAYPAHADLAGRIRTHARRMASLIDDVLDFARARLGAGIGVELCIVDDVNKSLSSVVEELQEAQPDCAILTNISVSRSVHCDLGRLQQVASNLLGNALTHGDRSRPVTISATADANDLVLEVWNAGEPIPAASLSQIFEPFWRHSTSGNRNGLGLGLHICSAIVQAHAGKLSVTSTWEGGTRFTVRLPLRGAAPATITPGASDGEIPQSGGAVRPRGEIARF